MILRLESFITAISEYINRKYDEYKRLLERVNTLWQEYKKAVEDLKRRWDIDSALIFSRLEELKNELDLVKRLLEELRVKRELELIDEETFSSGLATLNELLSKVSTLYEELKRKYEEIENSVKEHWIRSIDTVSITPERIELLMQEVESAKNRKDIDDMTYERIVRDLEVLKRVVQALEIIRSGRS